MDWRVLLFALTISILTAVLFGLAPAIWMSRPNLLGTIKEGMHSGTAGRKRWHLRGWLVTAEIVLAFILLTSAGLLIQSFYSLMHVDPGFEFTNVITAGIPISLQRHPAPVRLDDYLREILVRVRAVPGVREAALTSALPLHGWGYAMPYQIDGNPLKDWTHRQQCSFKIVSPSYFQTLGIRVIRGRALSENDIRSASRVTVINQTMSQREFPNEDPIGHNILIREIVPDSNEYGPETPWKIVGVIKDEKLQSLDEQSNLGMYVSNSQSPVNGMFLVARTTMNPRMLERSIRAAIAVADRDQVLTDVNTLEQIRASAMVGYRLPSILFGIFAAVAVLLAAVGLYGVTSCSVSQRTHEMGVRTALGASTGDLIRMVLYDGMVLTLIGLLLGICAALLLTQMMQHLLFGIGASDPATFAAVATTLGSIALFACYIPARRAAKVDPMVAMRCE
jgi:putative ABC transport system permease protein